MAPGKRRRGKSVKASKSSTVAVSTFPGPERPDSPCHLPAYVYRRSLQVPHTLHLFPSRSLRHPETCSAREKGIEASSTLIWPQRIYKRPPSGPPLCPRLRCHHFHHSHYFPSHPFCPCPTLHMVMLRMITPPPSVK